MCTCRWQMSHAQCARKSAPRPTAPHPRRSARPAAGSLWPTLLTASTAPVWPASTSARATGPWTPARWQETAKTWRWSPTAPPAARPLCSLWLWTKWETQVRARAERPPQLCRPRPRPQRRLRRWPLQQRTPGAGWKVFGSALLFFYLASSQSSQGTRE